MTPPLFLNPPFSPLFHASPRRESSGGGRRGGAEGRRLLHRTGRHRQRRLGAHDAGGTAGAHLCCRPVVQFLTARTNGYISSIPTEQAAERDFHNGATRSLRWRGTVTQFVTRHQIEASRLEPPLSVVTLSPLETTCFFVFFFPSRHVEVSSKISVLPGGCKHKAKYIA